jgi:pyruvate/2-oxoglutarate/acetoin dehydrogenase E1 component
VVRVGAKDVPVPFSPVLEQYVLPQVEDILEGVDKALKRKQQALFIPRAAQVR